MLNIFITKNVTLGKKLYHLVEIISLHENPEVQYHCNAVLFLLCGKEAAVEENCEFLLGMTAQ